MHDLHEYEMHKQHKSTSQTCCQYQLTLPLLLWHCTSRLQKWASSLYNAKLSNEDMYLIQCLKSGMHIFCLSCKLQKRVCREDMAAGSIKADSPTTQHGMNCNAMVLPGTGFVARCMDAEHEIPSTCVLYGQAGGRPGSLTSHQDG